MAGCGVGWSAVTWGGVCCRVAYMEILQWRAVTYRGVQWCDLRGALLMNDWANMALGVGWCGVEALVSSSSASWCPWSSPPPGVCTGQCSGHH